MRERLEGTPQDEGSQRAAQSECTAREGLAQERAKQARKEALAILKRRQAEAERYLPANASHLATHTPCAAQATVAWRKVTFLWTMAEVLLSKSA